MNQFLGFITAFFVIGWAVRWYLRQGTTPAAIEWRPPKDDAGHQAPTRWEALTDVAAERSLSEPPVVEVDAARVFDYEPADDVERRLEALVQAHDELVPPPAPVGETVEDGDMAGGHPEPAMPAEPGVEAGVVEPGPPASAEPPESIMGFCARCRDKRLVLNPVRTQTKKGKAAIRGSCEVCGAGMFVFISDSA